jgi:hypothetical protein
MRRAFIGEDDFDSRALSHIDYSTLETNHATEQDGRPSGGWSRASGELHRPE